MNKMYLKIVLFVAIATLIFSCKNSSNTGKDISSDSIKTEDISIVKDIVYSVPTPIETAFLIKNSGVTFDSKLLNTEKNLSKYLTTQEKAINLGIYSVDLCFVNVYNQNQLIINYISNIKVLTDELGILDGVDKNVVDDIEKNVNNRDYVLKIISDKILKNTSSLTDERKISGAYILFGAYIEGLYIMTQHANKTTTPDEKLLKAIIEQKVVLDNIKSLINQFEKEKVKLILEDLDRIHEKLLKIPSSFTETVIVYDSVRKETVIKAKLKKDVQPSPVAMNDLIKTVQFIRNSYTK